MNPVLLRLAIGWVFAVGMLALTDLVVLPALGILEWFPFNAVLWFGGFLAVVLALVYVIGSMFGYTGGGGGGRTTGRRQSKGARER